MCLLKLTLLLGRGPGILELLRTLKGPTALDLGFHEINEIHCDRKFRAIVRIFS